MRLPKLILPALLAAMPALLQPHQAIAAQATQAAASCPRPGTWLGAAGNGFDLRSGADLIADAARRQVVLLGEQHDNADHHRWQLQVLAALHGRRPDLVIGFEMFPRRVQSVLDRWVAGELTEAEFLRQADWSRVWGFDPQLYLPLFHFARINRIPMVALNVERTLVRQVGSAGWDSVPEAQREGVGRPAPAIEAYAARLRETFEQHLPRGKGAAVPAGADARLARFVDAQLTWDRAMAEALAQRTKAAGAPPLVVGVIGSGHLQFGHGVAHQLRALGIGDSYIMLPIDAHADAPTGAPCTRPPAMLANALFMVPASQSKTAPSGPRLGVTLGGGDGQVRIERVGPDSLAERSGLRGGDRVVRVAGAGIRGAEEITVAVRDQPPGTVLPITVQRDGRDIEILVRFPARAP